MPTPSPCTDVASVCGFIFQREQVVYADWLTWAGLAVIGYTLLMLTLVNVMRYRRRLAKELAGQPAHVATVGSQGRPRVKRATRVLVDE